MHTDTPHHQVRLSSLVFQEVDTEPRTVSKWLVTNVLSGKNPKGMGRETTPRSQQGCDFNNDLWGAASA